MPAAHLLTLITWPYARRRGFRCLLMVLSIALGVSLFVGMHLAGLALLEGFQQVVDRVAGSTQLQISAGDNGFPEEVLERVQSLDSVAVASPVIEAVVESAIPGQGSLLILAVDMTGDQKLRRYDLNERADQAVDDPLVFLAQADSILISRQMADRAGLRIKSRLPLETTQGVTTFTVRGIMRPGGLASAYDGALAVIDVYAAQKIFGRGRTFDRIDVGVRDGVPVDVCRRDLRRLLGPGFQVEEPANGRRTLGAVTRSLTLTIDITSLFALLIGVFIIHNTFSIAVAERRRDLGILRALGASQGTVMRLFLLEGGIAGVLGSVAGLPAGRWLATAMSGLFGFILREVYGMNLPPTTPHLSFTYMAAGVAIGVAASIAGALLPAYTAATLPPVMALQKGRQHSETAGQSRARRWLVLTCAAGMAANLWWGRSNLALYAAYILAVITAALAAPWVIGFLIRALRPALRAWLPVEGALAADSLLQAPGRTGATVSALMLSLALAISCAGIALACRESVRQWLENGMTFDFYVTPDPSIQNRTLRFPASFGPELQSLPFVEEVQPARWGRVWFGDSQVMLFSTDLARLARRARITMVEGDAAETNREAAAGQGVIVSENFSLLHHIHLGDTVELGTPSGLLRLPVSGVQVDYMDQEGSVAIDRAVYQRYWHDDSVNVFRVYLKPGAAMEEARQAILRRFSGRGRMFVMTSREVKQYVLRVADQWFSLTYVQLAVAILVAILGIVNSLAVSVIDRRRELGVLQAVGGLRSQVRRAIWTEAALVGFLGLLTGLAFGAVMLWFNLRLERLDSFGYRWDYLYPVGFALLLLPVILASAFVAALWPAQSAVSGPLIEALEYE